MENTVLERLVAVEERCKSNTHQIAEVKEDQKILLEMNSNIKVIAEQNKMQNQKINCIESDVRELKGVPKKRYDKIIDTAITVIVSAALGILIYAKIKGGM